MVCAHLSVNLSSSLPLFAYLHTFLEAVRGMAISFNRPETVVQTGPIIMVVNAAYRAGRDRRGWRRLQQDLFVRSRYGPIIQRQE